MSRPRRGRARPRRSRAPARARTPRPDPGAPASRRRSPRGRRAAGGRGECSKTLTFGRAASRSRRPSASRAGCTVAAPGKKAPPRKRGERQRSATSSGAQLAWLASGSPSSRRRPLPPTSPVLGRGGGDLEVAGLRGTRRPPPARAEAPDPVDCASARRCAISMARPVAIALAEPAACSNHISLAKPPLRPLGPCPQRPPRAGPRAPRAPARRAARRSRARCSRRRPRAHRSRARPAPPAAALSRGPPRRASSRGRRASSGTEEAGRGGEEHRTGAWAADRLHARSIARTVLIVVAVLVIMYVLYLLRKPISWLVIAAFIAIAAAGPVNFFQRRMRRGFAIAIVYVILILIPDRARRAADPADRRARSRTWQQRPRVRAGRRGLRQRERDPQEPERGLRHHHQAQEEAEKLPEQDSRRGGRPQRHRRRLRQLGLRRGHDPDPQRLHGRPAGPRWVSSFVEAQRPEHAERIERTLRRIANAVGNYVGGALIQATIAGLTAFIVLTILGAPVRGAAGAARLLLRPDPGDRRDDRRLPRRDRDALRQLPRRR